MKEDHMHSKNRVLAVLSAAVVSMAIAASSAAAADSVVIGSVNPVTGQTTLLTDKLKKQFTDGGPISQLYLLARPEGAGFGLVRAGRSIEGLCHTEVLDTLVSGNDVVVVGPHLQLAYTCETTGNGCGLEEGGIQFVCAATAAGGCKCAPHGDSSTCEKVIVSAVIDLSDVVLGHHH
jgi:hypothetical protein